MDVDGHGERLVRPPRPFLSAGEIGTGVAHELRIAVKPCLSHLPREIWLIIISHSPSITKAAALHFAAWRSLPSVFRERYRLLRSLAQVSRALRTIILPLVWEHVEACVWEDGSVEQFRFIAYILKRQCQGLCKPISRPFAAYVGRFTVSLAYYNAYPPLRFFARCLSALPNLHTLEIIYTNYTPEDLGEVFRSRSFPSVKKLLLPPACFPILRCFVNAEVVDILPSHCLLSWHKEAILQLAESCPHVVTLSGIHQLWHSALFESLNASPRFERVQQLIQLSSCWPEKET